MNRINEKIVPQFKKKEIIIFSFFVFTCIFSLLAQFGKYCVGGENTQMALELLCVLIIWATPRYRSNKNNKALTIYGLSCLFLFLTSVFFHGELPFVLPFVAFMFCLSLLNLKQTFQIWIYNKLILILSWLFFWGIVEYLLYVFSGINFFWASLMRPGDDYGIFRQGVFMIINDGTSPRFMSLFAEPGVLGNICVFLIATINYKKDYKKALVFLLAGVCSLSLSFYLLTAIWGIFQFFNIKINKFKYILVTTISLLFAFVLFSNYVQDRILDRITMTGSIDNLDNRNSELIKKEFPTYITSFEALFGKGNRTFRDWETRHGQHGAGVIPMLFSYGIIAILVLFLGFNYLYSKMVRKGRNKTLVIILYWISFYPVTLWLNPIVNVCLFFDKEIEDFKTKESYNNLNLLRS